MFRAIGFVIVLIALLVLMPAVFHGLEATLLKFFHLLGDVLTAANQSWQAGVHLGVPGVSP